MEKNLVPDSNSVKALLGDNSFIRSKLGTCPHGLSFGQKHSEKGICSFHIKMAAELFRATRNDVRFFQELRLLQDTFLLQEMLQRKEENGKLDPLYYQIDRNVISLSDKMRKQDEGIKVNQNITMEPAKIRQIIEVQAKAIEKEQNAGNGA